MERLGVPSTVIVTEPFQSLAMGHSASLGVPTYPLVVIPHPIARLDKPSLDKLADGIVEQVIRHLVGTGESVTAR